MHAAAGRRSAPYAGPWPGETCADDPGATEAYFRVPRGSSDGDFYRLPFPNDVRLSGGKVSLTGHPTPGPGLLGYDLVARYIADLEATVDGFSTYPTVFFRFSAPVDINGTLKADSAVQFFDVTQPAAPVALSFGWVATTDRNAYICNDWMAVRPGQGQPLTPGHTYAAVLSSSVLDAKMQPIQQSTDLGALLASSLPADAALAPQWPKYAPLRAWARRRSWRRRRSSTPRSSPWGTRRRSARRSPRRWRRRRRPRRRAGPTARRRPRRARKRRGTARAVRPTRRSTSFTRS